MSAPLSRGARLLPCSAECSAGKYFERDNTVSWFSTSSSPCGSTPPPNVFTKFLCDHGSLRNGSTLPPKIFSKFLCCHAPGPTPFAGFPHWGGFAGLGDFVAECVKKLSFPARFEEKWKFEEIGIFLRKNTLQESRWIAKVFFFVFLIFWIFDAELLGAG